MKLHLRWQILLATTCLALVLSLLSFQAQTAGLCLTRVPATGGTLAQGIAGRPQYLNPLLADANPVDQHLTDLIFDGLTRYDETGRLVPALARRWRVSENGRQVYFALRDDVTWHDGRPFTAEDVAFTYGLLQDGNFSGPSELHSRWAAAHTLWQSATITVTNDFSLTVGLPQPYAPFLDAITRGILPAHLLEGVSAATIADVPFNQLPVGTGPFQVAGGEEWQRSGRLRLTPNLATYRQGVQLDSLEFRFYPDDNALITALANGEIQAVSLLSPSIAPAVGALPAMRLYTAGAPRTTQLLFNLGEGGGAALKAFEVRQALAYALDRPKLVDEALNGQALPLEGPYVPEQWVYREGVTRLYAHAPVSATLLLDQQGWTLPEGAAVRQKDDQPLTLRLLGARSRENEAVANGLAAQWAAVGVQTEAQLVDAAQLLESLRSRQFDVALIEVEPSGDPDLYDFWSQEAIVRGQNYGGWNHRRASEALEAARQLWPEAERQPYYEAFLRLYDANLPALTLYQHVYTYAISDGVNEVEIGRVLRPRDLYQLLPQWFLLYRDVAVSCGG